MPRFKASSHSKHAARLSMFFDRRAELVIGNEALRRECTVSRRSSRRPARPLVTILEARVEAGWCPANREALSRAACATPDGREPVQLFSELRDGRTIADRFPAGAEGGFSRAFRNITQQKASEAKIAYLRIMIR